MCSHLLFRWTVKTYEDMTLEELEENEDEFGEEDEAAIEMYRWATVVVHWASHIFQSESAQSEAGAQRVVGHIHPVGTLMWDISPCRQKRLAEWKASQMKNVFGEVGEISGQDYVKEVNKAGDGIWVVLHLYKQG